MLRLLKGGVCRSTKLQMPRQTDFRTALPFCAADTIEAGDLALKVPGWPRLHPLQRGGEADFAMARRRARHFGCSLLLVR